jgi:hypothetical protein
MNLNVLVPADDPLVLEMRHNLTEPNQACTKTLGRRARYTLTQYVINLPSLKYYLFH